MLGVLVGFWGAWHAELTVFLLGCALVGMSQGGFQQARYAAAESVAPAKRGSTHMGLEHPAIAGLVTLPVAGMYGFGWLTGPCIDRFSVHFGYVAGAPHVCAGFGLEPGVFGWQ